GLDYLATNIFVTVPPGLKTQLVAVAVLDDSLDEPNETFTVSLANPTNALLGSPASATITILDDDLPTLLYSRVGNFLQLNWTGNYILQSNRSCTVNGWISLTGSPPVSIQIPKTGAGFFRLSSGP